MIGKTKTLDMLLALTAVWATAVPKPLFDVLGKSPEYWTANRIDSGIIVIFALGITLLPAALLGGVVVALSEFRRFRPLGKLFFNLAFAILLSLTIYHLLSLVFGKPDIIVVGSVAVAFFLVWIYWRWKAARIFFSIYSFMAVLAPVSFLFFTPTQDLLRSGEVLEDMHETQVELTAPVVIVVFDEFNLVSLVNPEGDIERKLFPNFHRLAKMSTWFQNATTNYGTTEGALPAICTGRFQSAGSKDISYKQISRSLFTLIKAPDGVLGVEPVTQLCPPDICGEKSRYLFKTVRLIFADLWLIYENIIVPDRYAGKVRPIPMRFQSLASPKGGQGGGALGTMDADHVTEVVSNWFQEGHGKSLVFLHLAALPHVPYVKNPDGTIYSRMRDFNMIGWNHKENRWRKDAPFYTVQAFQRYLLQAMYADRVLGSILESLEENQLLLDSTVVVTADHGVAFTPGEKRRSGSLNPAILAENNAVPLFWKSAGQSKGMRSTRNAELIDILPTLFEELGGKPTGQMDGGSLFSSDERVKKVIAEIEYSKEIWPEVIKMSKIRHKEIVIDTNDDGSVFVRPEKYSFLIGKRIAGAKVSEQMVELGNPLIFRELAKAEESVDFKPNFVEGWVEGRGSIRTVAIAINGMIADVVDVALDESGRRRFASVFDPSILKSKGNRIDFLRVEFGASGDSVLSLLRVRRDDIHLEEGKLVNAEGIPLKRDQQRLVGAFDNLALGRSGLFHMKGWIGDRKTWTPARFYLVVLQGEQQLSRPSVLRPDLSSVQEDLVRSGFESYVPYKGTSFRSEDFRMFVIFDDDTYAEMRNEAGVMQ